MFKFRALYRDRAIMIATLVVCTLRICAVRTPRIGTTIGVERNVDEDLLDAEQQRCGDFLRTADIVKKLPHEHRRVGQSGMVRREYALRTHGKVFEDWHVRLIRC